MSASSGSHQDLRSHRSASIESADSSVSRKSEKMEIDDAPEKDWKLEYERMKELKEEFEKEIGELRMDMEIQKGVANSNLKDLTDKIAQLEQEAMETATTKHPRIEAPKVAEENASKHLIPAKSLFSEKKQDRSGQKIEKKSAKSAKKSEKERSAHHSNRRQSSERRSNHRGSSSNGRSSHRSSRRKSSSSERSAHRQSSKHRDSSAPEHSAQNTSSKRQTERSAPSTSSNRPTQKKWAKKPRKLPPGCRFCGEMGHAATYCMKYTTFKQRSELALKKNWCFNCLEEGHASQHCRVTNRCRSCSGFHHKAMCTRALMNGVYLQN